MRRSLPRRRRRPGEGRGGKAQPSSNRSALVLLLIRLPNHLPRLPRIVDLSRTCSPSVNISSRRRQPRSKPKPKQLPSTRRGSNLPQLGHPSNRSFLDPVPLLPKLEDSHRLSPRRSERRESPMESRRRRSRNPTSILDLPTPLFLLQLFEHPSLEVLLPSSSSLPTESERISLSKVRETSEPSLVSSRFSDEGRDASC